MTFYYTAILTQHIDVEFFVSSANFKKSVLKFSNPNSILSYRSLEITTLFTMSGFRPFAKHAGIKN